MTQSASSPYPIRPIEENELDGFLNVDEHAFNTSPWSDERPAGGTSTGSSSTAPWRPSTTATPVGVTMCYSFQLSVPGQEMLPAAGVTFVAVLPTHRRRGVLSSLMRRQLADVRDRGEPLAILWASEAVIYGRYGYGRASWHLGFTLRRGEGRLASAAAGLAAAAGSELRLRIAEPEAALPELAKVYDAVLASPARDVRPQRRVVAERDLRPGGPAAGRQPAALPAGRGRQRAARLRALLRPSIPGPTSCRRTC